MRRVAMHGSCNAILAVRSGNWRIGERQRYCWGPDTGGGHAAAARPTPRRSCWRASSPGRTSGSSACRP
eukprot:2991986-Alexandrium_andersonii.AAC.1